ncbi:MAG: preprotein translocase subunit SecB [Halocynthiibacter sp.]|jgi:preprotein translocase subunit SecB
MAENGEATAQEPAAVKMQVLGQFIRDMSFENIVAQKGITGDVKPNVSVQVSLDAKKRPVDNQFEVATKFNIVSKSEDEKTTYFIFELDYAGIFHIENVPDEQMHPFLLIECPRMIFPFVRRIVNDITRDGGFPPLNLDNIDFVQLYRQNITAQQAAAAEAPAN